MHTLDGLRQFHAWTHGALARLLDHCAQLPAQAWRQPVPGFGWPSAQSQLIHIAEAEDFWVAAAQGDTAYDWWPKGADWWDYTGFDNVDQVRAKYTEVAAKTGAYLDTLDDAATSQPVTVTFPGGSSIEITPAKMLTHVLTHAFHHKGQLAAICRIHGCPPPETDLA